MKRDCGTEQWLVIDTKNGGIDGVYATEQMAYTALVGWKDRLGHDDVIVVRFDLTHKHSVNIGRCFLPARRESNNIHGGMVVDARAPNEQWRREAIESAMELLRDLYDEHSTVFDLHQLTKRIDKAITEFDIPDLGERRELQMWYGVTSVLRIIKIAIQEEGMKLSATAENMLLVMVRGYLNMAFTNGIQFGKESLDEGN